MTTAFATVVEVASPHYYIGLVDRRQDGSDHGRNRQGAAQVLRLQDDAKRGAHQVIVAGC